MKMRNNKERRRKKGQEYWQSYSDMMAALLLMFILIMAVTLYHSMNSYEVSEAELKQRESTITEQQAEIDQAKEEIDKQKEEMKEVTDQLEELNKLVGVKAEIIETLKEKFEESDLTVQVDSKTGAITFDSNILFEYDKADLSKEGKEYLTDFLPVYMSVLLSKDFKEYISEIIIEGHTDTNGSYMYNLNLSQQRAYSVAAYCLTSDTSSLTKKQRKSLRKLMTANGKSFSDPVYKKNGDVDMDASRRVVFKFRLKDDEMIEQMEEILGE